MLNKIKEQIIHILRKLCGYYELEYTLNEYKKMCFNYSIDFKIHIEKINNLESMFESKNLEYDILSARHEADILKCDILFNDYKKLIAEVTNKTPISIEYKLDDVIKYYYKAKELDYKKYLIAELEQILTIMKEKGIHPLDLIKRIINKAKRDIKE